MADSTRVDVPVRGREVQRRRALAVRLALPHCVDVRAALHERRHLPVRLRCVLWELNFQGSGLGVPDLLDTLHGPERHPVAFGLHY